METNYIVQGKGRLYHTNLIMQRIFFRGIDGVGLCFFYRITDFLQEHNPLSCSHLHTLAVRNP